MSGEPERKKAKLEIFSHPLMDAVATGKSPDEMKKNLEEAVKSHPFYDNAHALVDVYDDCVVRDGEGNTLAVLLREGLPAFAASQAANVLRSAATRTSLRATIYGGEAPNSGIAGYFDYRGSPIEFKHRKTSFTHEHAAAWPGVFPMVDYVSELYRRTMPECWERQNAAIPDVVRIHGTPFSTLTINSRFRTASHTDAGDFDAGYGCIACLEGQFKGLGLTFDNFRITLCMQPRDVLVFNTHHFHSNTEPELANPGGDDWSRLTCVFYYRSLLGERAAYEDYKRRLAAARAANEPGLRFDHITVKDNGTNLCRPDPVHAVSLTPFAMLSSLRRLSACSRQGDAVHKALLSDEGLQSLLFGEPLTAAGGPAPRSAEEKMPPNIDGVAGRPSPLGGVNGSERLVQAAAERERYLDQTYLEAYVSPELAAMWAAARQRWLDLVRAEWQRLEKLQPGRTNFSWNNRSEMNAAFFDLCEVAKQLLLGLLDKEEASRAEESFFWTLLGTHLNKACATELRMPPEAMSMRKLDVKVKDFNFGGTRYFKDMPPEEQQRRLQRKARIEEARRLGGAAAGAPAAGSAWLLNDGFDYQTEDAAVDYAGNQWPLPAQHAEDVVGRHRASESAEAAGAGRDVTVLVVLPAGAGGALDRGAPPSTEGLTPEQLAERERLLGNAAALDILHGRRRPTEQRGVHTVPLGDVAADGDEGLDGRLHITVCAADAPEVAEAGSTTYDFVVAQHVLAQIADPAAARAMIGRLRAAARAAVMLVETDVQCRYYYTLPIARRQAYDAVAAPCFRHLLRCRYGAVCDAVRPKPELLDLLGCALARYKLEGSPLNSMVLICPPA